MARRTAAGVLAVGLAFGLAGCGSEADESTAQPTPDPAPATEGAAEPVEDTPEPDVPEGLLDAIDVADGIVVAELPEVEGSEAAALRSYVGFEAARLEALMTNEIPADFYRVAAPELHGWVEGHVSDQEDAGYRLAGEFILTYLSMDASENLALIDMCLDDRGSYAELDDGTVQDITYPDEYAIAATVSNDGSGWQVTEHAMERGC